jgi:hypothetical protein
MVYCAVYIAVQYCKKRPCVLSIKCRHTNLTNFKLWLLSLPIYILERLCHFSICIIVKLFIICTCITSLKEAT